MDPEVNHYEFINSQTGNVIAYISFPANMDEREITRLLERKKTELAIINMLYIDLIYWQDHDHCIR